MNEEDRLTKIERDVGDIKNYLLGDQFNNKGVKQRLEEVENYVKKDKKRWWVVTGAGAVIIFLLRWGNQVIQSIIK
jgi:archaellum component FlaC